LENRRLGTVIASMARSFEKESYLEEVNYYFQRKKAKIRFNIYFYR